jgi:hypothetical protein
MNKINSYYNNRICVECPQYGNEHEIEDGDEETCQDCN